MGEAEALFEAKRLASRTNAGRWNELVYCILAGTQVPIETARRAHTDLVGLGLVKLNRIADAPETYRRRIGSALQKCGYRYYRQKAATIVAAAKFLCRRCDGDVATFLKRGEVETRVEELVKGVAGIGLKTANHWPRWTLENRPSIDT